MEVFNVIGEVEGKTCLLVDDMIDTGGTLVKGAQALKEKGAAKVYACCTHGVFAGNAIEKICAAPLEQVVATNSIPTVTRGETVRQDQSFKCGGFAR